MLTDVRITAIMDGELTSQTACDRLVHEDLEKGGRDNIAVIVAHFDAAEK